MDGVTHGLAGLLLGEAIEGPENECRSRRVFWTFAALAPDLDGISGLGGPLYYFAYHRRILHGFPALAVLILVGALVYHRLGLGSRLRGGFATLLALLLHLFLDVITSFGTTLFYPFSARDFSLDLTFIVDLFFTALIVLFLLIHIYWAKAKGGFAKGGLAVLGLYLCGAFCANKMATALIQDKIKEGKFPSGEVSVIPQPPTVFHWAGFISTKEGYWAGAVSLLSGKCELELYGKPKAAMLYEQAKKCEAGRRFIRFARYPYVVEKENPNSVTFIFEDLRFSVSKRERANYYYGSAVEVSFDGTVIKEGLANP